MGDIIIYALGSIAFIAILALLFSLPTMWLWNWLMPSLFGITKITWLQALCVNFLSGVLFKGGNYKG